MKVHSILAVSLAATSFSCLAFKSQPSIPETSPTSSISTLESKILGSFYSKHGMNPQSTVLGMCNASPVPGCSCPFCMMLRSHVS
ncbi:hypothetical protein M979_0327 [Buttiauxella noackiae ATCC 51607]|uniref:Lipoprotein n=1 Tax=Buttiauxella noackiae ATCC 51607 TaxID=1354255 RepID=A0A1B7HZG3_9ENTR|nr:hypothetical protein [Buttiauxella noackiae]OAT21098.1 hypothetical protein M979_0327 [Buttiauxella noackiae ATCC 51607]